MNRFKLAFLLILGMAAWAVSANPYITNVVAKQRYPWNGKIDISYEVVGTFPDGVSTSNECGAYCTNLVVKAIDRDGETIKVEMSNELEGDASYSPGVHKIVWNIGSRWPEHRTEALTVEVSLVCEPALYCVIDLSGGSIASNYPVSYLKSDIVGGWTDEYKTNKLLLRRIDPGTIPTRDCRITKSFYMGVFEVTQKQYNYVMGGGSRSLYKGNMRPVEQISWDTIRGNSSTYNWPGVTSVDTSSFIGRLQRRTGLNFDLPTSAQWEYACRAGTTSDYNNGGSTEDDLKLLGRYSGNRNDGKGGYEEHTTVGSYLPNAWGLYDMHGNVMEWCLDWSNSMLVGNDPVGASSGSYRVVRGGCWDDVSSNCRSNSGTFKLPETYYYFSCGFRLSRPLANE